MKADRIPALHETLADDPLFLDRSINVAEAARVVGLSPKTLNTLRSRGGGPVFVKRCGRVMYQRRQLLAWLAEGERRSTSDRGPQAEA